ncbi:MAG TPA: divalent metal cation transporter [Gallionellaceae bacterium]|nr:divalent metal cation transporter [Gallionellaceae bacterium]
MLRIPGVLRRVGPGLVTGAADDDPSGIATYSQAGAQLGLQGLWSVLFAWPLVVAVQVICARIGVVTDRGLAANLHSILPRPVLLAVVGALLVANTLNIAADLAAIGDAVQLVIGGPQHLYSLAAGLLCAFLQIKIPYQRYIGVLKWLTLSLLAYAGIIFTVNIPWKEVLYTAVFPQLQWTPQYVSMIVAIFGTTISPYLFFWQTAHEIEERKVIRMSNAETTRELSKELHRVRHDTAFGMGVSIFIAFFIMLTTAVTLHVSGVTDIQSSSQAAEALRPIVGPFAFVLFALGIIGSGMLAVPVLAGSAAYAVAESLEHPSGLSLQPAEARTFYAVIAVATLVGAALDFTPIDPIKALYWSAIVNGIVAVPLLFLILWMAGLPRVLGEFVIKGRLLFLGRLAAVVMAACAVSMLVLMIRN